MALVLMGLGTMMQVLAQAPGPPARPAKSTTVTAVQQSDVPVALQQLEQTHFDAVLMDCQMPEMDGYEATRELRRQPHLKTLPVIAMTAGAMSGDRDAALAAGMDDYVAKPFDFNELCAVLERWVTVPA